MARNIAILVQDEAQASTGLLQAFAQEGNAVSCIVCNELLPVALQMAKPDFAVVAAGDVWGEPGAAQQLLDAMGIPYLGADATTIERCRDAAQLASTVREAAEQGSIDTEALPQLVLGKTALDALAQTGQLGQVQARFGQDESLAVRANGAAFLDADAVSHNQKELTEATGAIKSRGSQAVIRPLVQGVEMLVAIMGDLSDILMLPPIEVTGRLDDVANWHAPVRLQSLADDEQDAQAIRNEVERVALDTFLACGCRDFACVRIVWDGGCARVLDVDAAPDLAEGGPVMEALKAAGINLAELANEFCEIADERLL